MTVHWIGRTLGQQDALALFRSWAEEAHAKHLPGLMSCALTGLDGYGETETIAGLDREETIVLLPTDPSDPPVFVELQIPFDDFIAARQGIVPPEDADCLMTSILESLPANQPDRDHAFAQACGSIVRELKLMPCEQRNLTLREFAPAIMDTYLQGEEVWTPTRVSMVLLVLGDEELCAEPGIADFVDTIGKTFVHLPAADQHALIDVLARNGALLARADRAIINSIVARFPIAAASAVLEQWKHAFAHPDSPSRNDDLARIVTEEQRRTYKQLRIVIEPDPGQVEATAPKTVANTHVPASLVSRTMARHQALLQMATATRDEVVIRTLPWQMLGECVRNGWKEELVEFLVACIGEQQLMSCPGSHACLDVLSRLRGDPAFGGRKRLIHRAVNSVATNPSTVETTRFRAVQLLHDLDSMGFGGVLAVWNREAALRPNANLQDAILMGYVRSAQHVHFPALRIHVTPGADADTVKLDLGLTPPISHSFPGKPGELLRRRDYLFSEQFRRKFHLQYLLDPKNLPQDPEERDKYVTHAFEQILRSLPALEPTDRSDTLSALPDAVMATRSNKSETVWTEARFGSFMRFLKKPTLCSFPGAEAFLIPLQTYWAHMTPAQQQAVQQTLISHWPHYNAVFLRGISNLLQQAAHDANPGLGVNPRRPPAQAPGRPAPSSSQAQHRSERTSLRRQAEVPPPRHRA
jgi:hypothetical protein